MMIMIMTYQCAVEKIFLRVHLPSWVVVIIGDNVGGGGELDRRDLHRSSGTSWGSLRSGRAQTDVGGLVGSVV